LRPPVNAGEQEMKTSLEKMRANQGKNEAKMNTTINAVQERMEAVIKTALEEIWVSIRSSKQEMRVEISPI
jgi:hypothetical protein